MIVLKLVVEEERQGQGDVYVATFVRDIGHNLEAAMI